MTEFKLTISNPKAGKTVQREIKDQEATVLVGKKIGDTVAGSEVGLAGYEFEITGGSDYAGFPMRKDVRGTTRKRILAIGGTGIKRSKRRGSLQRKTVAGNTIHARITQINMKVLKEGKEALFGGTGGGTKETAAPEAKDAPKEEKKESSEVKKEKTDVKKQETKEEKKEETPPKQEAKEEKKPAAEEKKE